MDKEKSERETDVSTNPTSSPSNIMSAVDNVNHYEKKERLRSWLGRTLKILITDGRCLVGRFVCTDRDGNTILENTWEYTKPFDDGKLALIDIYEQIYFS